MDSAPASCTLPQAEHLLAQTFAVLCVLKDSLTVSLLFSTAFTIHLSWLLRVKAFLPLAPFSTARLTLPLTKTPILTSPSVPDLPG